MCMCVYVCAKLILCRSEVRSNSNKREQGFAPYSRSATREGNEASRKAAGKLDRESIGRDTPALAASYFAVTLYAPLYLLPPPTSFPTAFLRSLSGIVDQLIRGGADRTVFHAGSCVISPMQLPGVPSVTPLHPRIYPNIRRL